MMFSKESHSASIDDPEVIGISDDDTNDSDDEYEFEDVLGIKEAATKSNQTPGAENGDDSDGEGINYDASSDTRVDNDGVASTLVAGPAQTMSNNRVASNVTPRDDTSEPDGVVHDESEDDSRVKAVALDRNGIDSGTSTSTVEVGNTVRDLAAEVAVLRTRLAEVESQLCLHSVPCPSVTPSKKRKRSAPASRRRVKAERTVNISATRAYVYWNESSEFSTYTWRRGRGDYCWVSNREGEKAEEVDGEYLLCFATSLSIEVRANADWLPIELEFNEKTEMFEGQAGFGSRRLEVDYPVVMDMVCGVKGEHVALVSHR